jgi:hypothetical protein
VRTDPIAATALRAATLASALVLVAALVGAAVRLLPWMLDPGISWPTLAPFAKSLLSVAVEAAILTGWPVGWALAAQRLVDRGEARVLASLGESPARTLLRLTPQGLALATALAVSSIALGRDAAAPGRVVNALLAEGRTTCASSGASGSPATHAVPFVSATWLCAPDTGLAPRLVGRAPIGNVIYTAAAAHVTDDLRRVDLDDARLSLPVTPTSAVRVHVTTLTLRGLSPWARASALPPAFRAFVVTISAAAAACAVVLGLLHLRERRARQRRISGAAAAALGASGPLAALATLRGLELRLPDAPLAQASVAWWLAFFLVPTAAVVAVAVTMYVLTALPMTRRTGSK